MMQITTLIENHVEQPSLLAEHGLSMLIETGSKKILFDTGQTDQFLLNAIVLGVDIADIDYVVLSHGHHDHTGGLYDFLKMNNKALVICKEEIFVPKYNAAGKSIGMPLHEVLIKHRTRFIENVTEIAEHVFIIPNTPIYYPRDTHFENLIVKRDGLLVADEMADELFMVIRCDNKISVVTACSHRGISNICKTATDYFKLPLYSILGGFHLRHCSAEQYDFIVNYLRSIPDVIIGACHCTGVEKFSNLQRDLKNPVFSNYAGKRINF